MTVLDCADGVLYSFECGEWLREESGLFRLLVPTRLAKWVQPERPSGAGYGAPRDAADARKSGGAGTALGFLRSLDRETLDDRADAGAGTGAGTTEQQRDASLERQARQAEKARAKANKRPREHLTHYEFLIETRPPEADSGPEPEPKAKDPRLRHEQDDRLKLDPKRPDAEQQTRDEKQRPKKSASDTRSVLTPSTVIRVFVEGGPAGSTEPTAGATTTSSMFGRSTAMLPPAQQPEAQKAEQQQQEHEFVLRLGQHFKQITRHRALVRLWNQPLIANIRNIRIACNKELYIERVSDIASRSARTK